METVSRPKNRKNAPPSAETADRLPPYAPEIEKALLGVVLQWPDKAQDMMNTIEERGVEPEWFYDLRHQIIFWAMMDAHRRGVTPTHLVVYQWLKDSGKLDDEMSGPDSLFEIFDAEDGLPSLVDTYLDTLESKHLQRRLLRTCANAAGRVYEPNADTENIIAETTRDVLALSESAARSREEHVKPLLKRVVDTLEHYSRGHAQMRGEITSGITYLDRLLGGIGGSNGNFFVLAARPGLGKTSLAMQIAAFVSLEMEHHVVSGQDDKGEPIYEKKVGLPVAVFSLEMKSESLVERTLFSLAGVNMQKWRTGFADGGDAPKLIAASARLANAKLWIDDEGRATVDTLKAKARRLYRQEGVRAFVIDYIQLMKTGGRRFREDRVQELAEISGEIQALGKELNCPFIVLAQMNRDYEKEPNREPRLSDLKDCGAIEQDADVVAFLYQPRLKDEAADDFEEQVTKIYGNDWSVHPVRVDALIAKNRFGPTGKAQLLFQKSCTRFHCYDAWKKQHGFKATAQGEKKLDLPSAEEMRRGR